MEIGFIGLGRMGNNMCLHLLEKGHRVVVYDRNADAVKELHKTGAVPAYSIAELAGALRVPRTIWIMVPAGAPVDQVISELMPFLHAKDVVIDGGNSFYQDSVRRAKELKKKSVFFLDVGTSGGLEGARNGACITVGGDYNAYKRLQKLFSDLAVKNGFAFVGSSGAGHYVKMVHNAIEYALLEAYGEGFELLEKGPYRVDLSMVAKTWSHGSVIRSWLLELAEKSFSADSRLNKITGVVGGGETGSWAVSVAKKYGVKLGSVELALKERRASSKRDRFAGKVIAAVRNQFGGHPVVKKKR